MLPRNEGPYRSPPREMASRRSSRFEKSLLAALLCVFLLCAARILAALYRPAPVFDTALAAALFVLSGIGLVREVVRKPYDEEGEDPP